ncbi:MAG: hypothetical protein IT378_14145 [Sandaracinaceae bacterium]|nr:hypothetical protein [Sandaracinaceae bacterium]
MPFPRACVLSVVLALQGCGAGSTASSISGSTASGSTASSSTVSGSTVSSTRGAQEWSAHPSTLGSLDCGHYAACPHAAELRVRWPGGEPPPRDARVFLDCAPVDAIEIALGDCAPVGLHRLRIETVLIDEGRVTTRSGEASLEIAPGAITEVELEPAANDTDLVLHVTRRILDPIATVIALQAPPLPEAPSVPSPESARAYAASLDLAFTSWLAALERIVAGARQARDVVLLSSAHDHLMQARALREVLRAIDPGDPRAAERVTAVAERLRVSAREASAMIAVTYACPRWAEGSSLAPVFVQHRPRHDLRARVERVRIAIDGVEVLDAQDARAEGLVTSMGLTTPGEHTLEIELLLGPRWQAGLGCSLYRLRLRRAERVVVGPEGAVFRVRSGSRARVVDPIEQGLYAEVEQRPLR